MNVITRRAVIGGSAQFFCRVAAIAVLCVVAREATAANYYWNTTTTGLWTDGANWSNNATSGGTTGTVPADSRTADTVFFNQSTVNGATTVELSGSRSIFGMTFLNTGSTLIRASASGTQTLSLGNSGITVNAGAGPLTIGDATNAVRVVVNGHSASATMRNDSASLVRIVNELNLANYGMIISGTGTGGVQIDGGISGVNGFTKSDPGMLTLTGSNTYSGATTISAGTMTLTGVATLGSGTYAGTTPLYAGAITNNAAFIFSSSANSALSGVISGTGALMVNGPTMLTLLGANTYTGLTTITGGTLQFGGNTNASSAGSVPAANNIVNNGTLIYNTLNTSSGTHSGVISGTGVIIKTGGYSNQSYFSTLTLNGSNTFTGSLLVQAGGVALNFSGSTAPLSDILSPSVNVSLGVNLGTPSAAVAAFAGTVPVRPSLRPALTVTGSAGLSNSQSLAGLVINDGIAQVTVTASAASSMSLSVGNLRRSSGSRGVVNFVPSTTGTAPILTTATNTNGIIGPWAVIQASGTGGATDWATSAAVGGSSGALTAYSAYSSNAFVDGGNTNITTSSTAANGIAINSLRFASGNNSLTLAGTATITSGGILVSAGSPSISAGVLRGPAGDGLQITTNGNLTISSTITDNGGPTGLAYTPISGGLTLSGNNTYTGRTVLMGFVTVSSFDTGTSGPLGVGGAIESVADGTRTSGAGGGVTYTTLNRTDYSPRFTNTANQSYGASVPAYQNVTWGSSFGSDSGSLNVTASGDLVLTGSNNFGVGVSVFGAGPFGSGALVLGSADAVGSVGQVRVSTSQFSANAVSLRYTAASAGLDLGSRFVVASTDWGPIDTNGQNVTWASRVSGIPTSGAALVKRGSGQLTLSGGGYAHTTIVAGGTLSLDSTTQATAWDLSSFYSDGISTLKYIGAPGTIRTQTTSGVSLLSGLLTVAVDNVGTSTTLNLSGASGANLIVRGTTALSSLGANLGTVDFRAVGGTFGTTAIVRTGTAQALTNGILGPWATVNGTDWATHTSGTIRVLAAYANLIDPIITTDSTANVKLALSSTYTLDSGTTAAYTLLQSSTTAAATISLPSRTLQAAGVMVARGAAALTIGDSAGSGTLQPVTAGGEIILTNFGSGSMTVNSVIANNTSASRLTISGDGRVVVTASNTLTGTAAIHGGTLQIGTGGTTGSLASSSVVMAPGSTLVFDRTDDYGGAVTYPIAGASKYGTNYLGGLVLRGGNLTLTPSANSSYPGFTQLLGGTLTLGNANNPLGAVGNVTFGGGVLRYGSSVTLDFSARFADSTSPIIVDTVANSPTFAYQIASSNTAGFEKRGTGTLTFGNVNSYLGTTTITAGVLKGAAQSFPGNIVTSSTLAFSNDTLNIAGVYAGVISGTGTVIMDATSANIVTLTGTNTFSGVPVIQQGRLDIGWMAAAGQPSPLGTSGTVNVGTTGAGGLLGYSGATNLTFDRVVNLAGTTVGGGLAADGVGAFIVTGNVTATGAGGKTFTLTGSGTAANEVRGVIANNSGSNLTALAKTGNGLWWVTGTSTFTGKTSITAGTLVVDRLTNSGTAGPLGAPTTNAAIEIGSTTGLAALRYSGTGSSSTNRGITLTGGTGTLEAAGSGGATFGAVGASSGTNALVLTGTSRATNTVGAISDASGGVTNVFKQGEGSWTLSALSGFTGRLTVTQGTIVAAANVPQNGNGVFGGGTNDNQLPLVGDSAAGSTGRAAVLLQSGVSIGRGLEIAALGAGATQEAVLGMASTSGTSTFAGGMSVRLGRDVTLEAADGGTVVFANDWKKSDGTSNPTAAFTVGSVGSAGTVVFNKFLPTSIGGVTVRRGTLRLADGDETIGRATPVTIGASGGGGVLDVNGTDQPLASLSFGGGGGSLDDLAGGGSLVLLNSGSAAASVNVTGTGHVISAPVSLDDSATFTVESLGRLSVGGVIANGTNGGKGLTKSGAGILELSAANSYSGPTVIDAGTLVLGATGSFAGSPTITVGNAGSSGAVLDLTSKSGGFTFGGSQTLKGGGTVKLASSGTLTVAGLFSPGNSPGLFTYDGGTTLLSGTTFMEITGTSRATLASHPSGFYDAVNVINGGILNFTGGQLQLEFSGLFDDGATFNLFSVLDTSSLAGNFSGVSVTGSYYTGLSWSAAGNVWKSSETGGQSLEFNATTGTLVIVVPEPAAIALAGIGVAAAAWAFRRRT